LTELGFLLVWVLVGFLAQFIDGSLGMAYGVTSTSVIVSIGVYPAIASASVHTAEIFTTFVSGGVHLKFGNVRRDIVSPLLIFGVLGGVIGAYVCTTISAKPLRAMVGSILLLMGFLILLKFSLRRTLKFKTERPSSRMLRTLGFVAAFIDALGGGGWGPIATTTLVVNDVEPSKAIGSVNFTEFFVTFSETLAFLILLGPERFQWNLILGLIAGGLLCAPIAAFACKKLPQRMLGVLVGITVILLSTRMLLTLFGLLI